jgi:hypothetical protein
MGLAVFVGTAGVGVTIFALGAGGVVGFAAMGADGFFAWFCGAGVVAHKRDGAATRARVRRVSCPRHIKSSSVIVFLFFLHY